MCYNHIQLKPYSHQFFNGAKMGLIPFMAALVSYFLLMMLVGANSKRVRIPLLVAAPVLTYLLTYLNGTPEGIPSQMIGHAIALIIGLGIYRSVDKLVAETERRS